MGLDTNLKANLNQTKTIQYKTLSAFMALSFCVILLLWVFQAIFFGTIYENIKTTEVKDLTNQIIKTYKEQEAYYHDFLDISFQNDVSIIVFRTNDSTTEIVSSTARAINHTELAKTVESVLFYMGENSTASFISDNRNDYKTLTYGVKEEINGIDTYFCVSSAISPVDTITDNLNYLLIFSSIGILGISIVCSYLFSKQISKPIVKMANNAKQITNNNTDIQFNSNEYLEVQQLSETLNYAIAELKKTDNIRKEVLANVSHELKTPLTMIKSYTELIKDISGDDKEKRNQHLDIIHTEAVRLEFLINDMMDYSKLESGIMDYSFTRFDLCVILRKFYSIYSEKFNDFAFTITCPKSLYIYADEKRIEQVITNLLNNAINYSKETKKVGIRLKKVKNEDRYKLEISDRGVGISEENLKFIFDRHFRTNSAKRTTVGSGIGLSIVKSILNHHNLEFGAVSKENYGSTFYIYFPTNPDNKEGK